MVREGARPRLHTSGFRGSSTTFYLPSETHHAMVGLQKARTSDRSRVIFTASISVGSKRDWDAARERLDWLTSKPAANTRYGDWRRQRRIGLLLPDGKDHWWQLSSHEDWQPLADEVVMAILIYALPAIGERIDS